MESDAYKYHPNSQLSSHSNPIQQSQLSILTCSFAYSSFIHTTMSTCGNCDCADKSQCVKKGNNYGVVITETEKSYFEEIVEVSATEPDGMCKCGSNCTCNGCTCGK